MKSVYFPATGVLIWLMIGSNCRADDSPTADFALGVGYAYLEIGGSSSQLHSLDAMRFDPCVSFAPFEGLPQLRLGGAFGVSLVLDNSSRTIISNDGSVTITASGEIPLVLLEPEFRLSWRQYIRDYFFIEPGLGVGGAIGQLHLTASDQSINKWDECFTGRAFLNLGFLVDGGEAGIQASYMHGSALDFGQNARGQLNQFYIGVFGAISF